MKNLSFILVISIIVIGCNSQTSTPKVSLGNDTIGFYAARNLKGLASFKIGESTYRNVLNQIKDEIRKDSKRFEETDYKEMPRYTGYQEKYPDFTFDKAGNIASSFYREDFSFILDEINDTITKTVKMSSYFIDNLEVQYLELTFYSDTLIRIKSWQNDEIDKIFEQKYGDLHHKKELVWKNVIGVTIIRNEDGPPSKNAKLISSIEENKWENERIIAESYSNYNFENENDPTGYSYFMIESKNQRIMQTIKDSQDLSSKKRDLMEEKKKKELIDKI
jgi:hypothetical protein